MKRTIAWVLLLPSVALAQESNDISYDYFDFDYFRTDLNFGTSSLDGTGWAGRFSVGIRERVYLAGGYRTFEADGVADRSTFKRLGFGLHGNISDNVSAFGEVGFTAIDLDVGTGNLEDDPGYLAGGIRWYVAEGYELRARAEYSDSDRLSRRGIGDTSISIGGDIYLTEVAAFAIDVTEDSENSTTFTLGLRFYHKKDSSNLR